MNEKENKKLLNLANKLRKEKKPFWKLVRELLLKPKRNKVAVNVSKINKYSKEGETIIIPGKLLGDGKITKPVKVAAFQFSLGAKRSIEQAGGQIVPIEDLLNGKKGKISEYRIIR